MSRAQELYDRLVNGGEAEVLAFIGQPVTEELFLDYKRSADDGLGTSLHSKDRANLSKAISGFGNSEGGVIIWGVDCRSDTVLGDVPTRAMPIKNPTRFKSWLEQATTGLTVPPHSAVLHHAIPEGFVLTLIPSGLHAPYQTVGELAYYIRSGSNFAKAPHAVLAGMFGRRPQPAVKTTYFVPHKATLLSDRRVQTHIGICLYNFGQGIAESVFVNLVLVSNPGDHCQVEFKPSEERDVWWGRFALNREMHLITRPGYSLPPEAYIVPVSLQITLADPIERDFAFRGICGSANSEPWRFEYKTPAADIIDAYGQLSRTLPSAPDANLLARRFNKIFFKDMPGAERDD